MPAPQGRGHPHGSAVTPAPGSRALGDALLAQMWHGPAPRVREDGKHRSGTSHQPHSKGAKLKNNHPKKQNNPSNPKKQRTSSRLLKPAIFAWVSRNTSVLKTTGRGGALPFHKHRKYSRDEVQNSSLTSKAFLLAGYPRTLAQPTGKLRRQPLPFAISQNPFKGGGTSTNPAGPHQQDAGSPQGDGWDPRSSLSFAGKAQRKPPFLLTLPQRPIAGYFFGWH